MKVTRRKMLTAMGVAASSAALGQIHKGDKDALEVSRPLTAKLNGANSSPVCLADFEPLAKERLSHFAYEYIASGAADELTIRWNREAFDAIRLRPKVLVEVERTDTRVTLFGQEMAHPISIL